MIREGKDQWMFLGNGECNCLTAEKYIEKYNDWCKEFENYQRAYNEWEILRDQVNLFLSFL